VRTSPEYSCDLCDVTKVDALVRDIKPHAFVRCAANAVAGLARRRQSSRTLLDWFVGGAGPAATPAQRRKYRDNAREKPLVERI